MKGPMRLWTSGDWWRLRCDLINSPDNATLRILEKKAELAAELYRQSAAGQRELNAQQKLYREARDDKAFQAFKSATLGKIASQRGAA